MKNKHTISAVKSCLLLATSAALAACSATSGGSGSSAATNTTATITVTSDPVPHKPGCGVAVTAAEQNALLQQAPTIQNPPHYDFTGEEQITATLDVSYQEPVIAGCKTRLRQYAGPKYDGRPVGPTMVIKPGKTYQANITNLLPDDPDTTMDVRMHHGMEHHDEFGGHGGNSTIFGYVPTEQTQVNHNVPGNFNVTNLHTHGWHVDPTLNSDNIFAAIGPGDPTYLQQVELPEDHPSGTFWYHAHLHGSTTIQVSSGMAGSLIVNDDSKGLEAIPAIGDAVDRLFVFQQVAYGRDGQIETYDNLQQNNRANPTKPVGYTNINRPVLVNGQTYPIVEIEVNEIQRWRFVHAGITDPINPMLVSNIGDKTGIDMYEIALDGLPTGTMPKINNAVLSPGYRTDVLAQLSNVSAGDTLYLVDQNQSPTKTIKLPSADIPSCDQTKTLCNVTVPNMRYILAQVKVVLGMPENTTLPSDTEIAAAYADYTYGEVNLGHKDPYIGVGPLKPISDAELKTGKEQTVHFIASKNYICPENGGSCDPCLNDNKEVVQCPNKPDGSGPTLYYMTCDGKDTFGNWSCMNFNASADFARTLALDTASKWTVSGQLDDGGPQNNHTFHIHVNPFQVQRKFVYGSGFDNDDEWVWKDTLKTPLFGKQTDSKGKVTIADEPAILKSRYTTFTGAFVQHCHILNHEDQGMMQVVEVRPALADLAENPLKIGENLSDMEILKELRRIGLVPATRPGGDD